MTPTRSLPMVALALAVAVIVVHARVIAGGHTWDDVTYHTEVAPPRLAAAELVQSGTLPQWWDGTGFGVPLLGEPSHGAMNPLLWFASTPRLLDLAMLIHLLWAALGVAVWARRRAPPAKTGVSDHAALVAGILVTTTGVLASAAIRGALPALAHLPWIGVVAAALVSADTRRERARLAAALGVLLGLVGLTGQLAVLFDAVLIAAVIGVRRHNVAWIGAALAGGLAISAAQWVPAVLALGLGAGAEVHGLKLARLVELIVPGSFGSTDPSHAIPTLAGSHAWAPSLFVGAPLLAFACVRTPSRRVLAVILSLIALALVVGRGGWPALLGAPELHVAALALVLGAHAAAGIDALADGQRRAVLALGVAAVCSFVAMGALGALRERQSELGPPIERALVEGGLGLVCMIIVLLIAWRVPGRAMPLMLALIVLPGVGAMPSVAPTIKRSYVVEPPAWAELVDEVPRPARVFRPAFMFDHREDLEDALATFAGESGWRWGLAAARSESPARLRDHDRIWLAASNEGGALLDRFGVGLPILPQTLVASSRLDGLGQRGEWTLVLLPVAPLASVMRGWRWAVDPADAAGLLFAAGGGTNILRGTIVLKGAGTAQPDRGPPLPCTIEHWHQGDISLRCTTETEGYAVVTSSPSPGWSVTVDGGASPWWTADVLRRAVKLDAGTHRVHWRYSTPGLPLGLLVAAIGLAGLLALWLGNRRAPPAESPPVN